MSRRGFESGDRYRFSHTTQTYDISSDRPPKRRNLSNGKCKAATGSDPDWIFMRNFCAPFSTVPATLPSDC